MVLLDKHVQILYGLLYINIFPELLTQNITTKHSLLPKYSVTEAVVVTIDSIFVRFILLQKDCLQHLFELG